MYDKKLVWYENLVAMPIDELMFLASKLRKKKIDRKIELCSIVNAKSGLCAEDCRFCAQSSYYTTKTEVYPLLSKEEIIKAAFEAKKNGAHRFSIVTSGRRLEKDEIALIADMVKEIKENIGISPCASLGAIGVDDLMTLKNAGLVRYHHNIETSESFYPNIATTHNYSERTDTIKAAKKCGLEVCAGGIFGIGESWRDRIEMAFALKRLKVDAVPLNFLVPIKGTPFESMAKLSSDEAIRIIALFRIILGETMIKIAAGREAVLKDFEAMMFAAGADGLMIGGYLTVNGRSVAEDLALVGEVENLWKKK
ncbi:MAG: biotin synthase BioB [Candidatus Omnitrophica bacterium]|nr:biotin synthase BioB [Candidatus Omnitrophota bacterium]